MTAQVTLYSTGWCPFCRRAKALLRSKGVRYEEIDLDREPERRREMIDRSGRTSVPQIWIGSRHIGGCDDLMALDAAGELDRLLAA
ncbi:MAG: glutaredoxin 3 [Myxococcota bacterium]